jgi:Na+/H+ antiporter NhaD/arsenite permease-like protein
VFFIGLFVLLGGIRESGLLAQFLATVRPVGLGEPLGFSVATAVLSNLVSNVPAVILLAPLATAPNQWFTLAAVSTLAGNATLLGAAANVIVAEEARARGSAFEVGRFVAFGLPLTVVTLALSVALASAAWPVP